MKAANVFVDVDLTLVDANGNLLDGAREGLQRLTKTTLEIGAGTLNQLRYEPESQAYDVVEPFRELYQDSEMLRRVRHIYSDISEIPEGQTYDRVTSIATFEHICDLPQAVARVEIMLTPRGELRV